MAKTDVELYSKTVSRWEKELMDRGEMTTEIPPEEDEDGPIQLPWN